MKIVNIKYERPSFVSKREFPGTVWEFSVETNTLFPHNHYGFGGLLCKHPDSDLWQARHYGNTDWSAPAPDRKSAIEKLLPAAFEAMAAYKQHEQRDNNLRSERRAVAQELRILLNANNAGFDITVRVNDWQLDAPIKFSVHIENLSERRVRQIANNLESAQIENSTIVL